ncbi:aminotransferase class V-fold PLP-dependent enzyme [Litorisediminicola beolgyonensis]|uniref:Aminotransferase class V-fold PLP-dependent enzyme n=1 Tax=Litorisediminicola beolgyonensis TaxID=1173614 RepID=A0ABW3ZM90_9RHOB
MKTLEELGLIEAVRDRFAHVETCPLSGPRIFFENAGGALTLKSVVETSAFYAAIPDNQGRDNPASAELQRVIDAAKADVARWFGATGGAVFVGESGTELLFRVIRDACLGAAPAGTVLGSTVEHPASRSAATRWAEQTGRAYISVAHDDAKGRVSAEAYAEAVTPETRVATILHTSPVTGIGNDLAAITEAIRATAPEAFIIVDGIQHASHGAIGLGAADVDAYVISPYKVFSRHGYGVAWASDRLTALAHDALIGGPEGRWELGTRDTGAYATISEVVRYLEWLGHAAGGAEPLETAGAVIHAQEAALCDAMLHGIDNLAGLAELPGVQILGGVQNPHREGLVSFAVEGRDPGGIVSALREAGVRVHLRKPDHYSGNILTPLGLPGCVRVSMCHYNTLAEVRSFLAAMAQIL